MAARVFVEKLVNVRIAIGRGLVIRHVILDRVILPVGITVYNDLLWSQKLMHPSKGVRRFIKNFAPDGGHERTKVKDGQHGFGSAL